MVRFNTTLVLAFSSVFLLLQCTPGDETGTARITYRLQNPSGDPLTCEEAGVGSIQVALFEHFDDAASAGRASAVCSVDDQGEGVADIELPVGRYESAIVTLQNEEDETATMYAGGAAMWEYVTVEISSGGVTDFVPELVGVFAGTPPECGNGRIESGEECDDGNTTGGDGCSATCQNEEVQDHAFTVDWVPTKDATDSTCTAINVSTVDITVFETGTASEVASVVDLNCTDRSFTFTDLPFGDYDVVLAGVVGGAVTVADGTALGVSHASPGPTSIEVDLEAR